MPWKPDSVHNEILSLNALIWLLQEKDFTMQTVWKNYLKNKVGAIMSFPKEVGL